MNKLITLVSALMLAATLSFADTGTTDSDEVTAEGAFLATADLLVVRPLGVAATIGGFGIFAVASPFAAMADAIDPVYDTLVANPGNYTFKRDLGDFENK
ncbi:MAG: hypothetical protein EBR82_12425 [Caulobacteraceae bacterium]|nr:hypothetical protein [Caulobacteraceae bacterium]